ncbi:DNA repair protein RadA [Clostridium botulinum]|uniref:DNA repair protein RadA n=1 Tax=Clostridium botulinum TaxID=1491 RepID=A0A0L9YDE0_CLOBO|nr:DNA repair protein RadA [Clostridium botulinum]ACD53452.1 DNA repair protein RadA [Clostridium botulinum E3 str. Alaska E43]AJF28303.1 DNA repair protein RadA [Clostridium botulinum]AJF31363.1 DNA repair protein RadA [Clostridium botulinum]KAI3345031.1 DNA repair protein RadA [Clostridium botulinum]KOM89673.1 DNA repair protein RadA [Clostridium botulinum]
MAKIKSTYICQQCGYEAPKWLGKCPSCNNWNTFNEEIKDDNKVVTSLKANNIVQNNQPKNIRDIKSGEKERYDTGIRELNRVLGGGLVKGSLTLISGDPGIGKSTLLLQTANNIALKYGKVLYVSGEESEEQIKIRGDRLGVNSENLFIISETNLDAISIYIEQINPNFVIIDSIQTVFKESVSSAPGSVSQVKECSNTIMRICKGKNIPFFLVAHVTKQGELAGPRVLEHMVDTVLYFEGERTEEYRILRTMKNRFGTTSEIGVFEMQQEGLIEVFDPSKIFLEDTSANQEGSVVVGVMEGTRPILIEIQALVSETKAPMPRRTAVGIDNQRLSLILAVLEKKLKVFFYNKDVYVNVVGGLNIDGTSADLGLALALISSVKSKEFKLDKTLIVGEVGLTGEIRPISSAERLVKEAEKLGFKNVIIPARNLDKIKTEDIKVIGIRYLIEAINKIF